VQRLRIVRQREMRRLSVSVTVRCG
jgi:hypothetical protein